MSEAKLDLAKITAEAKAAVANMSDAEVLRRLTNKRDKEAEKKAKIAHKKALAKAIEAEIDSRGTAIVAQTGKVVNANPTS